MLSLWGPWSYRKELSEQSQKNSNGHEVTLGHLLLAMAEVVAVVTAGIAATAVQDHLQRSVALNVQREDQGVLGDADLHRHQLKGGSTVHHLMSEAHEVEPLLPPVIASREMGQITVGGARQGAGVLLMMLRDRATGVGVLKKKMATSLV